MSDCTCKPKEMTCYACGRGTLKFYDLGYSSFNVGGWTCTRCNLKKTFNNLGWMPGKELRAKAREISMEALACTELRTSQAYRQILEEAKEMVESGVDPQRLASCLYQDIRKGD